MKVSHRFVLLALSLTAALPLMAQDPVRAGATASAAVEEFFRAAADSNLIRMSQLYGTQRGSAARTNVPDDHPRRMVVMQAALSGTSVRAAAETATREDNLMTVTTEVARGNCKVIVPVRTVRAREGWLVLGFDLPSIWEGVNKPCEATGRPGNTGG